MLWLAIRNQFQSRARLVISAGGVALALMLILALDAIFGGVEKQTTAYIDHSGADVFVSQAGVRNLHMSASSLPASVIDRVQAVPGVRQVTPLGYLGNMVVANGERYPAYVIGLPADATAGKPWRVEGTAVPPPGDAVIDRSVASKAGLKIGDKVEILGRQFTISGVSEGTVSLVNSVAFVSLQDMMRLRGDSDTVSLVLAQVEPAESPETVAARIESSVDGVTAQSRPAFAEQERRVVRDMSTDVITIMNLVGFLIGLAVMALTVYTATLARRTEYGVLKALGARNGHLRRTVLGQALISIALGLALGLAFIFVLAAVLPALGTNLELELRPVALLKIGAISLAIAGLSAILPVRQIGKLDPAMVFRRR
jgi:putative ABC transport system permease protein